MRGPADYLPLFRDLEPYRAPGERFQYSNAGYIVLGLVIEEVAGTGGLGVYLLGEGPNRAIGSEGVGL